MRRLGLITAVVTLLAFAPTGAEAAVKKLRLHVINITENPLSSPKLLFTQPDLPHDAAFVDDSAPSAPVLTRFRYRADATQTILVPAIGGVGARIFLSGNAVEGPGPLAGKSSAFTGTGSTAGGSAITWGIVTGWTLTGATYCNADPPVICNIAIAMHDTTVDPAFHSDFYDLGTWSFHTTGFTGTPFVHQYFTNSGNFGNNQRWVRGFFRVDATVPALPLVGVALLAGSLAIGASIALARRRDG